MSLLIRGGSLREFTTHEALTGNVLGGGPLLPRRGVPTWTFSTLFAIVLISVTVLTYLPLFFTI